MAGWRSTRRALRAPRDARAAILAKDSAEVSDALHLQRPRARQTLIRTRLANAIERAARFLASRG